MAWERKRGQRGAVAVEAAIVLSFVVIPLICGIIAWGVMLSVRAAMSQAASEGARAAVGAPVPCPATGTCSAITAATSAINAQLQNSGYSCTSAHMSCTVRVGTSASAVATDPTSAPFANCAADHYCALVTVSYPYSQYPKVWMPFMSGLLPSTISFTSMVQVS